MIITGGIARSASRRYLVYSEADFEFFCPAGASRCTDDGEIWQEERTEGPLLHAKFRCNDEGVGPQKLKFLLRFVQNVEYKRGVSLARFSQKFAAEFVLHFRMR